MNQLQKSCTGGTSQWRSSTPFWSGRHWIGYRCSRKWRRSLSRLLLIGLISTIKRFVIQSRMGMRWERICRRFQSRGLVRCSMRVKVFRMEMPFQFLVMEMQLQFPPMEMENPIETSSCCCGSIMLCAWIWIWRVGFDLHCVMVTFLILQTVVLS